MKTVKAMPGDHVLLVDGLVHLCDYVSIYDYVYFACLDVVTHNQFLPRDVKKKPLTCIACAGHRFTG